ncbi:MAG: hypothetical protein PHE67_08590 [Campylobacterales bacterium]|nr:hypothetical protein [Campylobacterales bacterium]
MIKKRLQLFQISAFLSVAAILPLLVVLKSDHYNESGKTFANLPLLELMEFKYKELSTTGIGVEVLGALGYHFADKDVTKNFKILQKEGDKDIAIFAKEALRRGDVTNLSGDVAYQRSDGYKLSAQKARFFEKTQTIKIDSEFKFEGDKFTAFGGSSDIDLKNKKIGVNQVRAKIITNNN